MASANDVDYDETLSLHGSAAELCWHQGQPNKSQSLLDTIFDNARNATDKAHAWIIQSKLLGEAGNLQGALNALRTSLVELGLDCPANPTWEQYDEEYRKIKVVFQEKGVDEVVTSPLSSNTLISAIGRVMSEAISAAFWSDTLLVCTVFPHVLVSRLIWHDTVLSDVYPSHESSFELP